LRERPILGTFDDALIADLLCLFLLLRHLLAMEAGYAQPRPTPGDRCCIACRSAGERTYSAGFGCQPLPIDLVELFGGGDALLEDFQI
jgi:hypothetical protein